MDINLDIGIPTTPSGMAGEMPSEFDVVIIGGGPAGLTAALYTSRARLRTLIIEKLAIGGQVILTNEVEDYPGIERVAGVELIKVMEKQARNFGSYIISDAIEKIQDMDNGKKSIKTKSGREITAYAVIVAVGAAHRQLGVKNEVRLRGKGVSYCGVCDGAFFRNMEIAVIGGGDTAAEESVFLTRFAKKVYLIHRRDRLRAAKMLQERALSNAKIQPIFDTVVEEIEGEKAVEKIKLKNIKTNRQSELIVQGVFIFVGLFPNTEFLAGYMDLTAEGYIKADEDMGTQKPGIFAAGDCVDKKFRQIVTAAGDGAIAAYSAQHYVEHLKGTEYV